MGGRESSLLVFQRMENRAGSGRGARESSLLVFQRRETRAGSGRETRAWVRREKSVTVTGGKRPRGSGCEVI
jgi:hypothetical protein